MAWHITMTEGSRARQTLERYRTWEAAANGLYAMCDRWERNNRSPIGNPHIVDWAARQRGYLASAIPNGRKQRPRPWLTLHDPARGVTVRLERRSIARNLPSAPVGEWASTV